MSTILEGQLIRWREPAKTRERVCAVELLRVAITVLAVAGAALYFATAWQTPAVVSALVREATARAGVTQAESKDRPSPVIVTLRPSARDARPLQP